MAPTNSYSLGIPESARQRNIRSLSIRTADGSCVSLLNDDIYCDMRRRSSMPDLAPAYSPMSRTPSPAIRLPSLSALVGEITPKRHLNPLPAVLPPCTRIIPRTPMVRKYRCEYPGCEKAFTTSGHMTRHYRIHTGEKNYECLHPGCTSRFSRQDNMMQHYRTHLSPRSRRGRTPHRIASAEATAEHYCKQKPLGIRSRCERYSCTPHWPY